MSDISHSDEIVTKQDLSSFYQGILPYLGGIPEALSNKFNRSDIYSTDEKIIGCWTDGRPLYQKTLDLSSNTLSLGINLINISSYIGSNIDTIFVKQDMSVFAASPYKTSDYVIASATTNESYVYARVNTNTHVAELGVVRIKDSDASKILCATVQYTKTTDAANLFNCSTESDYSTTEKVIGTWVDGKPLYQKTFSTTSPVCTTNGTEVTKDVSIGANVDTIVDVKGILINSTGATHILPAVIPSTVQSNTKIPQIKVNGRTNNASSDKNKVRISNSYATFSNLPMYITVQYTKV